MRVVGGGHDQSVPVTQHFDSLAHSLGKGHRFVQSFAGLVVVVGKVYATTCVYNRGTQ